MSGLKRSLLAALVVAVTATGGMLSYQRAARETGYAAAARNLEAGRVIEAGDVRRISGRWPPGPVTYASASQLVGLRLNQALVEGQLFFPASVGAPPSDEPPALAVSWHPQGDTPPPAVGDRFIVRKCGKISASYAVGGAEDRSSLSFDFAKCFDVSASTSLSWPPRSLPVGREPNPLILEARSVADWGDGQWGLTFYVDLALHERIMDSRLVRLGLSDPGAET